MLQVYSQLVVKSQMKFHSDLAAATMDFTMPAHWAAPSPLTFSWFGMSRLHLSAQSLRVGLKGVRSTNSTCWSETTEPRNARSATVRWSVPATKPADDPETKWDENWWFVLHYQSLFYLFTCGLDKVDKMLKSFLEFLASCRWEVRSFLENDWSLK